tara:strand:+ start:1235 stop:1612 length:378 start_codon:yes stop_codon:yes gene_type:complete
MPWTKEKQNEYMKQYRIDNKEKIKKLDKKGYETRKSKEGYQEKKTAYQKQYRKDNPDKRTIQHWRVRGMIDTDWDLVYEMFIAQTNCWICDRLFDDKYPRNLDHNHETGELRYVVCNPCNIHIIG